MEFGWFNYVGSAGFWVGGLDMFGVGFGVCAFGGVYCKIFILRGMNIRIIDISLLSMLEVGYTSADIICSTYLCISLTY